MTAQSRDLTVAGQAPTSLAASSGQGARILNCLELPQLLGHENIHQSFVSLLGGSSKRAVLTQPCVHLKVHGSPLYPVMDSSRSERKGLGEQIAGLDLNNEGRLRRFRRPYAAEQFAV
jgi:hypothetical protein